MFDLATIAKICNGKLVAADDAAGASVIQTAAFDSREIASGDLFVALRGEKTHGHAYIAQAQAQGAVAALVEQKQTTDLPQIVVGDSRVAFTQLAAARREQFPNTIIAITGSNGKTTVKEMVTAICRAAYGDEQVHCNRGNYNNDLGVSLTLMSLQNSHRVLVAEVGMDRAGELTALREILQPHIMLVNNAQRAHIGFFDSVQAIARAKGELLAGAGGIALINSDDPHYTLFQELASGHEIISFGMNDNAHVHGTAMRAGVTIAGIEIPLQVQGEHNAANAIAAAAVGRVMGIPMDAIQQGLSAFGGVAGRLQTIPLKADSVIIDDTYNANPDSVLAAIAVLQKAAAQNELKPILVLGDMLALGDGAHDEHEKIIQHCLQKKIQVMTWGSTLQAVMESLQQNEHHFASKTAIADALLQQLKQEAACVLVKGSRGCSMEAVVKAITAAAA